MTHPEDVADELSDQAYNQLDSHDDNSMELVLAVLAVVAELKSIRLTLKDIADGAWNR